MAIMHIGNLDEEVLRRLDVRSKAAGVSLEEEVRRILTNAVMPQRLGDFALATFGPMHGHDLALPVHPPHDPRDAST